VHSWAMEATAPAKKFVVVLNRSYELSRLTSGLGHVTAGLAASLSADGEDLGFLTYESADGQEFPSISDYSFIVLKGRGGQMKTFHAALKERQLPCVTYLDTMLDGGTAVEMAATKQRTFEELEVLAVATFGDAELVNALTKKFSLWQ
jgi:hypothetical protein